MGDRFRLVVNEVEAVAVKEALPRLPVARAVWVPKPDLKVAAAAWILAGGAHHTAFSQAVGTEHLEDYARIAGLELAVIDAGTSLRQFEKELRWEEMYHILARR
jgi:L-arabinose isomerase